MINNNEKLKNYLKKRNNKKNICENKIINLIIK